MNDIEVRSRNTGGFKTQTHSPHQKQVGDIVQSCSALQGLASAKTFDWTHVHACFEVLEEIKQKASSSNKIDAYIGELK